MNRSEDAYVLVDICVSTTGTSNADTDVISRHVLLCDDASILWESGRKHHEQMVGVFVVICFSSEYSADEDILLVSILPPPVMIFCISSSQSGPTISSASSMIVYLMPSVPLLCRDRMWSELT